MKVTKEQLVEIISEEIHQVLNEQDEPYDRRRPVDKPYTDYGTGADKRFAYVLNGRLNKGMDSKPGFMQRMKSKFGGRDPILDMAMKRLHNVAYEMFYKDLSDLPDEEQAEKRAYRLSDKALSAFRDELRNLKDAQLLRINQGMKVSKEQRADIERLMNNWDKSLRDTQKKAGAMRAYNEMTQKALKLQDQRKYKEANELIDKIIAGVESGALQSTGLTPLANTQKNRLGFTKALKTDLRGRLVKDENGDYIGK